MNSPWTEAPPSPQQPSRLPGLLPQALALMALRVPRSSARPAPLWLPFAVAALLMFAGALVDDLIVALPRWPNPWAFTERSFPLLAALLLATAVCTALRRPALATRLAATGLLAVTPALLAWPWLTMELDDSSLWHALPWLYALLLSMQSVRWINAEAERLQPALVALANAALLGAMFQWVPYSSWWWNEEGEDYEEGAYETASLPFSAEELWNQQPARMQAAIDALAPQRAGVVDLYALGVAGDGSEPVFRNEVDYFSRLIQQRFASPGRVLSLVNAPDSVEQAPIASVTNLRTALNAIGERMDRDEDMLLLFLTSHGSRDHELYLGLDPLPLDALDPETLRDALDGAGIRWRVLVVSSCYSGGFIDALKSPETLVITAARADRTSFGCGAQQDITWFGEAFLSDALNQTTDFFEAFREARRLIRGREADQGEKPSYPQIARGEAIGAKLAEWRGSFVAGAPMPFTSPR